MAGKGGKRQKALEAEIASLELKKRNGLMRAIAAFVGMAVLIWLKLAFEGQGAAWAASMWASMALFILALVAAGVAGIGMRDWSRARNAIRALEAKLNK